VPAYDAAADAATLSPEAIRAYFQLILGRPPESEGVVRHYAAMGITAAEFVRVLLDSEEVSERYRRRLALAALREASLDHGWPEHADARATRVLLFGAYGNGNLGDAAQAEALSVLLRRMLPGPLTLAATSWERREAYALPGGTVFPPDALLRSELLPRAGHGRGALIVIGGGGLLGTAHFPLHAEAWVEWLARQGTRWALVGIGGSAGALAEPAWRNAHRRLIAEAAFVGVRDAETLQAAQAINPAARWFPDPILARALLSGPPPAAVLGDWSRRPTDAVVIPRTPNGPADVAANRAALAFAETLRREGRRVRVVGMEEVLDRGTVGAADVTYVHQWDELLSILRDARVVVSSRLHGAIAALEAGCVLHGLLQPKIGDLMAGLGLREWFAPEGWPALDPDLSEEAAATFFRAAAPGRAALRTRLEAAMTQAAAALAPQA
jgi:polysaccharide pyruvyl transferase WcaK-like protein